MGETRKVRHAGRFGSRYGKGIRDRVVSVEEKQRSLHECPNCGFVKVKRISTGLFKCMKCGFVFTGGAFTPSTMSGRIVRKMVSQRKFLPLVKELIEAKEEQVKGLEQKKQGEKEKKGKKGKAGKQEKGKAGKQEKGKAGKQEKAPKEKKKEKAEEAGKKEEKEKAEEAGKKEEKEMEAAAEVAGAAEEGVVE